MAFFDAAAIQVDQQAAIADAAGADGDSQCTLSWTDLGYDRYDVYWHTSSGFTQTQALTAGNVAQDKTSPYAITGLTNGNTYYAIITGFVDGVETAFSNEVTMNPSGSGEMNVLLLGVG